MSNDHSEKLADLMIHMNGMQLQSQAGIHSVLHIAVGVMAEMAAKIVALESRVEELENRCGS